MAKKLGLALSSGGARGLAHIGVIEVLEENNIKIDYVSGSSMGAIIGAYYALYGNVAGTKKIALEFKKRDLVKLVDLNDPRISIIKGVKLKKFLGRLFGKKKFSDTIIPLKIAATALEDGSTVVFSRGSILDAVMASCAFPGIFPVVKYKGKHLIDGGFSDIMPIDLLKNLDIIIAVDLFSLDYYKANDYNFSTVFTRSYEIIGEKIQSFRQQNFNENVIIVKPKVGGALQLIDFEHADKFIKAGREAALKKIKTIKKQLK